MIRPRIAVIALSAAVVSFTLATGIILFVGTSLHDDLIQREKDSFIRSVEFITDEISEQSVRSHSQAVDIARQRAAHLNIKVYKESDLWFHLPENSVAQEEHELYLTASVDNGPTLVFARSLASLNSITRSVTTTLLTGVLPALLPLALTGLLYRRELNGGISELQNAAHRFARGELGYRVSVSRPAGPVGLAATLNGMAEQLHQRLKTANQQRRESEAILASMVEGILVVETTLKIRSLNDKAASLLGTRADRARGQYLHEVAGAEQLETFAREAVERNEPMERTLVVDHGEPSYYQVHSSPLEAEAGRARGMLLVLNDITRIKRLEDMRRDFVANVSHELKTPVTSIRGFVETLLDEEIEDPAQRERFLRIVLRHSSRLQTILEDLLSLSRLEQADHTIPRDLVNLHTLTARVQEGVERQAQERSMRILPSITGDPVVSVNANLIEQAVVNLLDNAIKYGRESTNITLGFVHERDTLLIEVTNLGPPIPESSLSRVFERFYRVDKARSRSFGGTGLGLAIVKHIAMAHGGSVTVQSDLTAGTTFRLHLPVKSAGSPSATPTGTH